MGCARTGQPRLVGKVGSRRFSSGLELDNHLKKRDNFRVAFDGFDPAEIATWGAEDVTRLLKNEGIIRHRGKIEATIGNAQAYLKIDDFSAYCWSFVDGAPLQNQFQTLADVPPFTPLSVAFPKTSKNGGSNFAAQRSFMRGWKPVVWLTTT